MGNLILVDCSWLMHRSYYAYGGLSVKVDGQEVKTGTLVGNTQFVATVVGQAPDAEIIYCLDSPYLKRRELDENYKANRDSHPEVYELKDELQQVLSLCPNVKFAFDFELEADDLMAALFFQNAGRPLIIYTADSDLLQLKRYGAVVSRSMQAGNFIPIHDAQIEESIGVDSSLLVYYKAVRGDRSDNIPNALPRIKTGIIKEFCTTWRDHSLDYAIESFRDTHYYPKMADARPQIEHNFELVSLLPNKYKQITPVKMQGDADLLDKYELKAYKKFLEDQGFV